MAEKIQYGWYVYTDDLGREWRVNLRKRTAFLGGFTQVALPPYASEISPIPVWPHQNLRMRHVTIRNAVNKYIQVPAALPNAPPFTKVGFTVDIPKWDSDITGGAITGESEGGVITGRTGERLEGVFNVLQDFGVG